MLLRYNKTVLWKIINPAENRIFFETTRKLIKIRGVLQDVMWKESVLLSDCQCVFFATKTYIYLNYYRLKYKPMSRISPRVLSTLRGQLRPPQGRRNPRICKVYNKVKERAAQLRRAVLLRKSKQSKKYTLATPFTWVAAASDSYLRSIYFVHKVQKRREGHLRKSHLTMRQKKIVIGRAQMPRYAPIKKWSRETTQRKQQQASRGVRRYATPRLAQRGAQFEIYCMGPILTQRAPSPRRGQGRGNTSIWRRETGLTPSKCKEALVDQLSVKYMILELNGRLSNYLNKPVTVFANNLLSTKATQLLTTYQTQLSASLPYFMRRLFFHRDLVNIIVCASILRSSYLLSFYLARLLERVPRHKWFFHIFNRFVSVFKFYCRAPISLKVLVKGRVNKKMRKHVVCVLRTQVALSKMSSAVDYSIAHSFTRASVLGVKVWVVSNSKTAQIKTFDQKYRTY